MNITRITDLDSPELQIYTNRKENQLYRINEPEPGIFIAESPNVIMRALAAAYEPISFLLQEGEELREVNSFIHDYPDAPVYVGAKALLEKITGMALTRGVLCAMKRRLLPDVEDVIRDASRIAVLENVVNPTNLGAIFRSAAALGIDAVILTPGCTDPLYRRAARVSMGTVFQLPWTYLPKGESSWPADGMKLLKDRGFATAAMALKEDTVSIDDESLMSEKKKAIILGTEGDGLMDDTIAMADYTVMIPMAHGVDSLNVAAASAVAFWQIRA
ncbi:TrmH family RNA methyltransferase [Butyrivibrio sp. MC2013]|uniref:TrmH family RNA methyltransferase n=1 Tax=Butyrivibrio sp. MC2013 TaxID=1280686 RepID=UPI00040C807C|nr:RNA methyltransferase [Butyrivibrio sp. MC2013]